MLNDPVALFTHIYDSKNGIVSIVLQSQYCSLKRMFMPAPRNAFTISSTLTLTSFIFRSSPKRASAVIVLVVADVDLNSCQRIMTPPSINQIRFSPPSTLANVCTLPSVPSAKPKGSTHIAMLGLVPNTEFLKWPRDAHQYRRIRNYSDRRIQSDLRGKRGWILLHFIAPPPPSTTDAN